MLKPKTPIKAYSDSDPTGWRKVAQTIIAGININSALVLLATGIFGYLGVDMKGTQEKGASATVDWRIEADRRWNRVDSTLKAINKESKENTALMEEIKVFLKDTHH